MNKVRHGVRTGGGNRRSPLWRELSCDALGGQPGLEMVGLGTRLGGGGVEVTHTDGTLPWVFIFTSHVGGEALAGELRSAAHILKCLSCRLDFWSWVIR